MQAHWTGQSHVPSEQSSRVKGVPAAEQAIVAAAMSGCDDAFEQLVKKYEARVFRLANAIARRHEDAEEIMQNAFVQALKNITHFRGDSSFYTWLSRITINEALMKIRRRRFNEISIDDSVETDEGFLSLEIEDWGPNPEQRYSQAELRKILATTIAKLPAGYRTVFQLRDVEGLSTEETARMVGLTPCAVKTRLRRARNQLRGFLNEYFKPSFQSQRAAGQSQIRCRVGTSAIGHAASWNQPRHAAASALIY